MLVHSPGEEHVERDGAGEVFLVAGKGDGLVGQQRPEDNQSVARDLEQVVVYKNGASSFWEIKELYFVVPVQPAGRNGEPFLACESVRRKVRTVRVKFL